MTPWVLLPVLGAPVVHAPVLRWDLAPPLKRPISARAFGANKTWRGAVFMTAGPVGAAAALSRSRWFRERVPERLTRRPLAYGALLGVSLWAGELPNSYLKRRLDVPPGGRASGAAGVALSVLDQADFVPAAALLLRPLHRMTLRETGAAFAVVALVHLPINAIGYAIGARKSLL